MWWVVVVCKPKLVFYFGPDQAFGLGLILGPSGRKCQAKFKLRQAKLIRPESLRLVRIASLLLFG